MKKKSDQTIAEPSTGLPEVLAELRKQKGLSQKEVAETLGITQTVVSQYESGHRSPRADILDKLSKLYQVKKEMLLKYHPKGFKMRILRELEGASEQKLSECLKFLQGLRD